MKKNKSTTQKEQSRSFSQEMKQAFNDWVKHLPFLKSVILQSHEGGVQVEEGMDQPTVPHPTGGVFAGPSLDTKG